MLRQLEVLNKGKAFDSEMVVTLCQLKICKLGSCMQKLREIDKKWAEEDKYKGGAGRFDQFKTLFIAKIAILAADMVKGIVS